MSPFADALTWYWRTLSWSRWRRKIAVLVPGLVCLGVFGPFATYTELALPKRIAYWTAMLAGVGLLMHGAIWPMLHAASLAHLPRLAVLALGSALAAIPGTAVVYVLEALFPGMTLETVGPFGIWAMVAMMGMLITSLQFFEEVFGPNRPAPKARPGQALPPTLRPPLISISTQDHYLEIVSVRGQELVRMRLSDALEALADVEGAQIHRSHWVSAEGLQGIERDNGRPVAVLSDGRRLPISRPYFQVARQLLQRPDEEEAVCASL